LEFRRDPLRLIGVIVAPERSRRPHEGKTKEFRCPFCKGNEELTPPEIARFPGDGEDWLVRVIPNKYPIVPDHEVIVETPSHEADIDILPGEHLQLLVRVWYERLKAYHSKEYVLLFRNYGLDAGASLVHPHAQLIALDRVPDLVEAEVRGLSGDSCLLCGGYATVLVKDDGCAVGVPNVQAFPYEVWIFPTKHARIFEPSEAFVHLLRRTIAALKRMGIKSYNMVLHQSPRSRDYHWHLEILPRMGRLAGFELGTGMRVLHHSREEFMEQFLRFYR